MCCASNKTVAGEAVAPATTAVQTDDPAMAMVSVTAGDIAAGPISQGVADTIPGNASTPQSVVIGGANYGVIGMGGDHDWFRVDLVAGTTYRFNLDGVALAGSGALGDTFLRLRSGFGVELRSDDDSGPGLNSQITFTATTTGTYFLDAAGYDFSFTGGYTITAAVPPPVPTYTLDQIANFLTNGFWEGSSHRFSSTTISYNVQNLTAAGQTLARAAFDVWAGVGNLTFTETTGAANIAFDDSQSGAYASGSWSGGFITSMNVNISTDWLATYGTGIDSYSFQTYVHEIGHALGLGHAGSYNGSATYGSDNLYVNDTWPYTVMSYFSQSEANFGSYRFLMGVGLADHVAIANLYGANTTVRSGNTVYGHNATAGSLYSFNSYTTSPAFIIYDTGGTDTLDASGYSNAQTIVLAAESFSSIGGLVNNIGIARGVTVENAIGGSGVDRMFGNAAVNSLFGGSGNDTLNGRAGGDILDGGIGSDTIDYSTDAAAGGGLAINAYLASNLATDGFGFTDTLTSIENVIGTNVNVAGYNDIILGTTGSNFVDARGGGDIVVASDGADVIYGGLGVDALYGGDGADTVVGSGFYDAFNGEIDYLFGDAGADYIYVGSAGNAYIEGGSGDDNIYGGSATDYVLSGTGVDRVTLGSGVDLVILYASELRANEFDTYLDFTDGYDFIYANASLAGSATFVDAAGYSYMAIAVSGGYHLTVFAGLTAAQVQDQVFFNL